MRSASDIECKFINKLNKTEICELLSKVFYDFEWNIKNLYGGDTDKKINMGEYFKTAAKNKNFYFEKYDEYVCLIAGGHNFELNLYDCQIVAYKHVDFMINANIEKVTKKDSKYNERYVQEMYNRFGETYKEYFKKNSKKKIKILTLDEQIIY